MKRTILITGSFMLLVFTLQAQEKIQAETATAQENKNEGVFKFQETEYNFGTIKQGETILHNFKFTNSGNEPIIIKDAQGSCHCTVPEYPHEPIRKGESATIKVRFDSGGKQGMQDKTVTINSNASPNPMVLHLKGTVEVPPVNSEADKTGK